MTSKTVGSSEITDMKEDAKRAAEYSNKEAPTIPAQRESLVEAPISQGIEMLRSGLEILEPILSLGMYGFCCIAFFLVFKRLTSFQEGVAGIEFSRLKQHVLSLTEHLKESNLLQ